MTMQKESAGPRVSLVVCDMDGTLFNSKKTVPEVNRAAIMRAREKGVRFSICTGRIQPMTECYVRELNLDTPIITANGALIWDPVERKVLWERPMDNEEMLKVLKFCRDHQLDCSALGTDISCFSPDNVRKQRFVQYNEIAGASGFPPIELREFDENFDCVRGKRIHKVLIYEKKEGELQMSRSFLDSLEKTEYTSSEKGLLDIGYKGVSKGNGLVRLAGILGIPLEKVSAMGDFDNDIPMLEVCGFPVAMGNGCQAIKEKAAFVTRTNEEGGVAWAMEHFLDI